MKRVAIVLLVGLVGLVGAGYFVVNYLIESSTDRVLSKIPIFVAAHGVTLTDIGYRGAAPMAWNAVCWYDLWAVVQLVQGQSVSAKQRFRVDVERLDVIAADFSSNLYRMEVKGMRARTADGLSEGFDWASPRLKAGMRQGRLLTNRFVVYFNMDLAFPEVGIKAALKELIKIVQEGRTELPVEIDALVYTELGGEEVRVRIITQYMEEAVGVRLVLDEEDLRTQAKHFSRPLTDAEIKLVAQNPLDAPDMLYIKKYAEQTAGQAHQDDPSVPEDAYRHVLWSYLLTRKFGADFAQQITDAHEVGSTTNTAADHRMDYNNNEVGRRYAAEKVREGEILARVQSDPQVILSAH